MIVNKRGGSNKLTLYQREIRRGKKILFVYRPDHRRELGPQGFDSDVGVGKGHSQMYLIPPRVT